jgi:hypothetical protein
MEPSHLLLDEIKFECEIRSIVFENEAQAVRALRAKLRAERTDEALWPPVSPLSPEEEIPICYAKMLELTELVMLKACVKNVRIRQQIYSRFCHLETRVDRIEAGDLSNVENLPTTLDSLSEKLAFFRQKFFPEKRYYRVKPANAGNQPVQGQMAGSSGENPGNPKGPEEIIELDLEDDDDLITDDEEDFGGEAFPEEAGGGLENRQPQETETAGEGTGHQKGLRIEERPGKAGG